VAFTINPVTGDSSEIMINAAWGLGEAVVGGRVTPDEYLVDKDTRQIKRKTVASKTTMVVPDFSIGGTAEVEVKEYLDPEYVDRQCLSDEEILQLVDFLIKTRCRMGLRKRKVLYSSG